MEFDFSTILSEAQGWIGWLLGILGTTGIGTIVGIAYRVFKEVKRGKEELKSNTGNLEGSVREAVAKALPSDMTVKVQAMAEREFAELTGRIQEEFAKNLEKAKDNEKLLKDIATALICLKSVPNSLKDKLAEDIGKQAEEFENKIVLSLIPSVGEKKEEEAEKEVEVKVEQQEFVE